MPAKPPTFRPSASPVPMMQSNRPKETFYGSKAWKDLRQQAIKRDCYQCAMPTCTTPNRGKGERLTVDHIVERKDGGADALHNLRTLCSTCHEDRHAGRGGGGTR